MNMDLMPNIPEKFFETAKKFSRRPALKFKYHGAYISVSYKEFSKRVREMAKGLAELGVERGDRVAILSENRTGWARTDLATLSLGAISVPIHTTLSPTIIKYILNDSEAKVLLVSKQELFNKVVMVLKELKYLETIVYINIDNLEDYGKFDKKFINMKEVTVLGEKSEMDIEQFVKSIDPEDVASIIYTSGTTAMPKGVMLTHKNLLSNAEAAVTAVPIDEHDVLLSFLPLSHVLERTAGYYAPIVVRGACVAYAESIKTLTTNLKEVRPTVLVSVPRVFEKIHKSIWEKVKNGSKFKYNLFIWALKQEKGTLKNKVADLLVFKKIRNKLGGRFRFTISGGATLNHKLARFFDRVGIKIVEGYGLTETSPVVTVNRPDNIKFGTVGQELAGVNIEIAKDKEILVKGTGLMKGYYKNQALTDEVIDSEGWFHTGDLGHLSKDGFLVIIGRKKEMISMSNGKIAWPEQMELILNNDRYIMQSFVYGNNRSYLTALIIPDMQEIHRNLHKLGLENQEPIDLVKNEKLIKYMEERLEKINQQFADWEKIRRFVLLPKEFSQKRDELTPTMKLRRSVIEKNHKTYIDQMYG